MFGGLGPRLLSLGKSLHRPQRHPPPRGYWPTLCSQRTCLRPPGHAGGGMGDRACPPAGTWPRAPSTPGARRPAGPPSPRWLMGTGSGGAPDPHFGSRCLSRFQNQRHDSSLPSLSSLQLKKQTSFGGVLSEMFESVRRRWRCPETPRRPLVAGSGTPPAHRPLAATLTQPRGAQNSPTPRGLHRGLRY